MSSTSVPIGDVCMVVGGGTPARHVPQYYGGDIPWVTPKDMKTWEIRDAQIKITKAGLENSATRLVPENSVLVVVRSGVLKHTIPVAISRTPVAINQDMKAFICTENVDPDYLARFIKARSPEILQWVRATTADNFPIDKLKKLRMSLPPLPEQRRIAAILDKADALRAKRRAALAQLDTLTQSLFFDMFGDPATNTKGWAVCAVSDYVSEFQGGKSIESESGDDLNTRNRILKVSAVTGMRFLPHESKPVPDSYEPRPEHFVRTGDLLFSRANTTELVGAVALVDQTPPNLLLPDKIWRVVWRGQMPVEPIFIWALFQTAHLRYEIGRRATGTSGSMKNISQEKVLSIRTIVPPIALQREFVRRAAAVERLRAMHRASLAMDNSMLSSLQERAFMGGV